ncbi:MAG: ATP-binding cassette domain-containing protein [Pseudomonadota bacterium]
MIDFISVSKFYRARGTKRHVLRGLNFSLPPDRNVAVIGRNGAGKTTLLRLISGTIRPNSGTIVRHGRVSWPLAFSGGFHPILTGRQNVRFIARASSADVDRMDEFVEDFSELGDYYDVP